MKAHFFDNHVGDSSLYHRCFFLHATSCIGIVRYGQSRLLYLDARLPRSSLAVSFVSIVCTNKQNRQKQGIGFVLRV